MAGATRPDEAGVAPRQGREAEIKDAVQLVEGDAHVEAGFGGGKPSPTGGLHAGEAVDVKPADGGRVDGVDDDPLFGLEAGAERGSR